MKKAIAIVMMFLIFGTMVTPASAQHCDVRNGDSMWRIAKRYHVLFHDVLRLNQHFKNPNMIHPNDEIELPDGNTGETTNQPNNDSGDDSASHNRISKTSRSRAFLVFRKSCRKFLTLSSNNCNISRLVIRHHLTTLYAKRTGRCARPVLFLFDYVWHAVNDSNVQKRNQNPLCYRYTNRMCWCNYSTKFSIIQQ